MKSTQLSCHRLVRPSIGKNVEMKLEKVIASVERFFKKQKTCPYKLGCNRQEDGPDNDKVPHYYRLSPAKRRKTKKEWSIAPCESLKLRRHVARVWEEFESALGIESPHTMLIRVRVEALIRATMSEARKRARIENEPSDHFPPNLTKLSAMDLVNWTSKRIISMPFLCKREKEYHLTSEVDYVVWSGDHDDLDVSLLILRAPTVGAVWSWSLLKSMAMIHHARKLVGRDAEIYGLVTDSYEWGFARIDNKSRYSRWFLDVRYNPQEIITHMLRIFEFAAFRAGMAAVTPCGVRKTSHKTGCRVLQIDEFEDLYEEIFD